MKVFFSRPPKRCQERRTPQEPTPLPASTSSVQPDKTESTSERAGNVAVALVSTAANPLRKKEGRNIGEGEQESRHAVRRLRYFYAVK